MGDYEAITGRRYIKPTVDCDVFSTATAASSVTSMSASVAAVMADVCASVTSMSAPVTAVMADVSASATAEVVASAIAAMMVGDMGAGAPSSAAPPAIPANSAAPAEAVAPSVAALIPTRAFPAPIIPAVVMTAINIGRVFNRRGHLNVRGEDAIADSGLGGIRRRQRRRRQKSHK
jgi:hypothetical protein